MPLPSALYLAVKQATERQLHLLLPPPSPATAVRAMSCAARPRAISSHALPCAAPLPGTCTIGRFFGLRPRAPRFRQASLRRCILHRDTRHRYFYPGDFLLSSSHHAPMFCGSDSSSASANASSCCARSPMIYRHASSWSFSRSSISSPLMQNATSPFSPAFSGRTGVFKSKGARLNSSFFCAVSVTY